MTGSHPSELRKALTISATLCFVKVQTLYYGTFARLMRKGRYKCSGLLPICTGISAYRGDAEQQA